jgi:hypothetical protein
VEDVFDIVGNRLEVGDEVVYIKYTDAEANCSLRIHPIIDIDASNAMVTLGYDTRNSSRVVKVIRERDP